MQAGQEPIEYEIVKGTEFTETTPATQPKMGYTVTWNETDLAKLSGAINENVTITATETAKVYNVTFVDAENIVTEPTTVTYNEAYDFTPNQAPTGYHFKGFTKGGAEFTAYSGTNWTIDEDVELTVVWEKDAEPNSDGEWTKNY